jgi:hypothetical protein
VRRELRRPHCGRRRAMSHPHGSIAYTPFGGECADGDRNDDLIVANDALSQKTSIWRAFDSRLRSKTVQFRQARRELPHNFRVVERILALVIPVTALHRRSL